MPPPSPSAAAGVRTSCTVLAGGTAVPGKYQLVSLRVVSSVNRIPFATVEFADGDAAKGDFALAGSSLLAPGTTLEIKLGYADQQETVFQGIVTRQAIRQRPGTGSLLQVEARDAAVRMTITRRSAIWAKQTDSKVLEEVIGRSSGVTPEVTETSLVLDELTQYYSTDWDFVVARAEANGFVVTAANGTVTVAKPDPSTSPVLLVTYGTDVLEFRLEQDAETQYKSVQCTSWDYTAQAVVNAKEDIGNANALGSDSTTLAAVTSPDLVQYQSSAPWTQASLTAWAQGLILRSELAKTRGELRFAGSALPLPGKTIQLAGFGTRFNGVAFVSAVTHQVEDGRWTTEVGIGLDEKPFAEQQAVMAPAAAGLVPGASGLLNGVVQKIDADPMGQVRVQVQIPVVGTTTTVWARLAQPYATNDAGMEFYPEQGDEVVLGFVSEDPSQPVILGSLYSASKKAVPYPPDAENTKKAIKTKAGLLVLFDDQNKVTTVSTPAGNQLVLSEQDQGITIKDQNGNELIMSSSGIVLKSVGTIALKAQSGVTVETETGNVELTASAGKLAGTAANVALSATAELTASGNAKASVQSGAMVEIQGGLVKIN